MAYFYSRLIPPRPDFATTTTEAERQLMQQHSKYMARFAAEGWAVAYGPVLDPAGHFGACFWDLPADVDLYALLEADPAVVARSGFRVEAYPMAALVVGCRAR